MFEKRFLLLVFLLFFTACAVKEKSVEILSAEEDTIYLQEQIASDPGNLDLRKELARKYFEIDTLKADYQDVRPGNEPFYLEADSDVCLLIIHGFSASPYEVRRLSESLNKQNITVYAPLLAGHGIDYRKFGKYDSEDWLDSVQNGLNAVEAVCSQVFVAGLSLGGNIALNLAKDHEFTGLILIGTPIEFKEPNMKYAGIARFFINTLPNEKLTEEQKKYYYYDRSINAVYYLKEYVEQTYDCLDQVEEPLLILQSKNDITIDFNSALLIYNLTTSSENKTIIPYFSHSHVLVNDIERDKVFFDILDFIRERSTS